MLDAATAEREFFRAVNPLVEPWARAGCASPSRWPFGVIVVETTGRRSGESRSNPVLAMPVEDHLIVGTARGARSDWFRNLEANPEVRYWLDGERRAARAIAFARGAGAEAVGELPALVKDAARGLMPAVEALGCRFAVLVPDRAETRTAISHRAGDTAHPIRTRGRPTHHPRPPQIPSRRAGFRDRR